MHGIGGYWTYEYNSTYARAIGGDLYVNNTLNSYFRFQFHGQRVTYWYTKAYNRGYYDVYLDNQYIETVNACTAAPFVMRQIGRTWTMPSSGPHELKIVNAAVVQGCTTSSTPFMDIDAFSVDIVPYTSNGFIVNGYNDNDAAIRFSPNGANPGEWWAATGLSGAFLNDNRNFNTPQAFFRQTIAGQSFGYVYAKAYNRGLIDITIDGEWAATLDEYAPSIQRQQILKLNTPTKQLNNGVVIDTHIVHGYVRGDKNTQSTDKLVDVDRLDIDSKPIYANPLFNTIKAGLSTNYGAFAIITASNPIIRATTSDDWVYSRVFTQKIISGSVQGFCEIGQWTQPNGSSYIRGLYRIPGNPTTYQITGSTIVPGQTHTYNVTLNGNTCSMMVDNNPIAGGAAINVGFSSAEGWGAGTETGSPVNGLSTVNVQYLGVKTSPSFNYYAYPCPSSVIRDISFYSLNDLEACYSFTITGNN